MRNFLLCCKNYISGWVTIYMVKKGMIFSPSLHLFGKNPKDYKGKPHFSTMKMITWEEK